MRKKEILNLSQLVYWLTLPKETLYEHFTNHIKERDNIQKRHVFVDMNAPVLYVAHIDTVRELSTPNNIRIRRKKVHSTGLDDRLGCYLAFRLNQLGLKGDVLLCDFEEIDKSTAKYFKTNKSYNWVVEFDREGIDVVTYDLDSPEFLKALRKARFKIGTGIGSDISSLQLDNNPCMFNLGVGYERPHSFFSYLDKKNLVCNINKFAKFYKKYEATSFTR